MSVAKRFRASAANAPETGASQAGFTLMEVLVALTVISVALAALLSGVSDGTRNARYLRDKILAHWVAMNHITEVQVRNEWPAVGKKEGSSPMGARDWHWTRVVANTPDADMRRLELEVRYDEEDAEPLITRAAFLPRPRG